MPDPAIPGLITVVTPCLNGGAFLPETLASILSQDGVEFEYLFVDGGSIDGSVERAESYGDRVSVVRAPGSSQAEAINAGLALARGEFFTFVNADDVLEPGALALLARALQAVPLAPYVYGEATFIDESGATVGMYPTREFSVEALAQACFIAQPATLVRTAALRAIGGIDPTYHAAFDYDLWMRFARTQPDPVRCTTIVARARMHRDAKTFRTRTANLREVCALVRRHFGYVPFSHVHAYAGRLLSKRDQFFEPPVGTPLRALLTLAIGLFENPLRAGRFTREFAGEVARLRRRLPSHERS